MRILFFITTLLFIIPNMFGPKGISSELTGRQVGGYLIYR